ncbi:MAG: hypothetical protein ACXWF2_16155, partial [Usitatibacter sp.]
MNAVTSAPTANNESVRQALAYVAFGIVYYLLAAYAASLPLHQRLPLFGQLATLLRRQYGLPILRSYVVAYHAARGAVVFQRGHAHADYELALPDIAAFYTGIRRVSSEHFDVQQAARRELDWWI